MCDLGLFLPTDEMAGGQARHSEDDRPVARQKITINSGGRTFMTGVGPAGKAYSVTL